MGMADYQPARVRHLLGSLALRFRLGDRCTASDLETPIAGKCPVARPAVPTPPDAHASLSVADFEQILTTTEASFVRQYEALLGTENVHLDYRPDGIRRLAEIAFAVNERQENIGARRLYTVMERLLEEISFHAGKHTGETLAIDAAYVDARLAGIVGNDDLARYIL